MMKTTHAIIFGDADHMKTINADSVDLVVTSPPYPMVAMWDDIFGRQDASIGLALAGGDGKKAFELMHQRLDPVWKEVYRVLKEGGLACINIGDATRTIGGDFALYPNHVRILRFFYEIGLRPLPCILWRKQTNAPNKFMGSGMLPAGAYVTLEHEYILILRKGSKRNFNRIEEKTNRRESALFWEERNLWFSDIWFDIKGSLQTLNRSATRKRSAAYPFELVYRLINMYSVKGDVVLDPFLGTGTTMAAAMSAGRHSMGYEIDKALKPDIDDIQTAIIGSSQRVIRRRLLSHADFIRQRLDDGLGLKHANKYYGFPVMTAQEKALLLNDPIRIDRLKENIFEIEYATEPQPEFCRDWNRVLSVAEK